MKIQRENTSTADQAKRPDYYVVRGPRSANELREFLKKRYTIFRNSDIAKVAPPNLMRMDLDAYDLRSYHFGVFTGVNGGEETLVGYIRLITETATIHTGWVVRLAGESDALWKRIEAPRKAPLPSMYYFPELNDRYHALKRRGEWVAEPSRFGLDPSVRSSGLCRFVINAVTSFWYALGIESGFLTCAKSHNPFYTPVGIEPVPETAEKYVDDIGLNVTCMTLTRGSVTAKARQRIEQMARAFSEDDEVRYFPNRDNARVGQRSRSPQVQPQLEPVAA